SEAPVPEDSESDHPDFRSQTPEVEESTFNRRGPLTIPEVPEKSPTSLDDLLEGDGAHEYHGFEKQPRPPTPPKDINDEDVKPSAFSLAHGSHTTSPSHPEALHSILKRGGSQYGEPWFDFKTIDPRKNYSVENREQTLIGALPGKSWIMLAVAHLENWDN
ncbi:unnamed protein product, partial [Strongylus vulgaris]